MDMAIPIQDLRPIKAEQWGKQAEDFALHGQLVVIHRSDYVLQLDPHFPNELMSAALFHALYKQTPQSNAMYRLRTDITVMGKQHPLTAASIEIVTPMGRQKVHAGDWVFESPTGAQWVVLKDLFPHLYAPTHEIDLSSQASTEGMGE